MGSVMSMDLHSIDRETVGGTILKEREQESVSVSGNAGQREAAQKQSEKKAYEFAKRAFDIIGSAVGMIVLIPVFLLLSVLILAERSGKHVFYKQRRIGRYGREIYIYKFRTMVDGADNVEKWLDEKQLRQYYAEYKVENDPRVTRVGKFLRRTGLDELPQILNILKGDMTIVGPRPIQEYELEFYGEDKNTLLSVRPGLTGYWQVYCTKGKGASYTDGKRQRMELMYIRKRSMWLDIKLCFGTFGALVRKIKRGQ